jgi:catechol 2,3-dioxygenase-like lactoylglutathione lyase family enzyme
MGFEVVGLDHVQLAMPPGGEERAAAFYDALLELARQPKPEPLAARGGCWFSNGAVAVHLGVEEAFRPARNAHPALLVRDLAGLADRLMGAGIEVRWSDELPGVIRCYVDDPFGNRLELIDAPG